MPYDNSEFSRTIFPAKYFEACSWFANYFKFKVKTLAELGRVCVWTISDEKIGPSELLDNHYEYRHQRQLEIANKNTWDKRVYTLKKFVSNDGKNVNCLY